MTGWEGMRDEGFPPSPTEVFTLLKRYPLLVAGCGVLCALLALLWVGYQTPTWSAHSVVLLRSEQAPQDAAAAPLHAMVQNPDVATELARLRARGPAVETVRSPDAFSSGTSISPQPGASQAGGVSSGVERHRGLTTQVDDESLLPIATFLRQFFGTARGEGRLFARSAQIGSGAPATVRVGFPEPGVVSVSIPTRFNGDKQLRRYRFQPGDPVEYHGLKLWLHGDGSLIGKTFIVRRHKEREAVRSLMERVTVKETEPRSGVLRLSYKDSDPHRAAEVVNALIENYLALHQRQVNALAGERIEQVERELGRVQSELRRSFEELVLLQSKSPLSINAEESAKSLTLNLTSRSVDYTTTQLELTLLDQAVLSLERGEMAGLARIAEKSTDPLTRILITQIADLQAQAQLQERADSGAYKHLLQQRGLSLREARQDLTEQRNGLILALAALGEDGRVGLGQLVGGGDATLSIDPASTVLVDTITRLGVKRAEYLSGDYLPEHPEVVRVDEAIARNLQELQSVLSGRVEHLRVQIDHIDTFSEELAGELEQHPLKEREEIAAALERFRVQVLANLTSLRDSCQQQVASLSHEIEKVERDLARLPSNEKQQLSSLQRVENAKLRVADLLEARDMVRMKNAFVQAPAEVVDPATPPARRDSPRLTFTVALALLMGLVIGLMLALVRDRVHGTVLGASEFERALGLSILGRLPDFGPETGDTMLRRLRRDLVEEPHGLAASSFRSLRTNLGALLSVREGARVLGITSTVDGEGKTSTSFGIAGALARSGQRTLLIDTTGVFDDGKKPGLLQMIEGGRQDVLRRCGIEGLDILLSGGSTAALADALDRAGENPLRTVAAPYDAVIVDLPSIDGHGGKRGETLSIARHLCALAIVSRRRTASRLAIRGALRQLDRLGTPVLGAVFNEAPKCRWRLPLRLPTRARSRASGLRRAA